MIQSRHDWHVLGKVDPSEFHGKAQWGLVGDGLSPFFHSMVNTLPTAEFERPYRLLAGPGFFRVPRTATETTTCCTRYA